MTMMDIAMSAPHAAKYMANALADGRDYTQLLADQRRGRRTFCIPFHRRPPMDVWYYQTDLDAYIATERTRCAGMAAKPMFRVERDEFSPLPPTKITGVVWST